MLLVSAGTSAGFCGDSKQDTEGKDKEKEVCVRLAQAPIPSAGTGMNTPAPLLLLSHHVRGTQTKEPILTSKLN